MTRTQRMEEATESFVATEDSHTPLQGFQNAIGLINRTNLEHNNRCFVPVDEDRTEEEAADDYSEESPSAAPCTEPAGATAVMSNPERQAAYQNGYNIARTEFTNMRTRDALIR